MGLPSPPVLGWVVGVAGLVVRMTYRIVTKPVVHLTFSSYLLARAWLYRRQALFAARARLLAQWDPEVLRRLLPDLVPAWASTQDWDRAEFINQALMAVWPALDAQMFGWIAPAIERAMQRSAPSSLVKHVMVDSLSFGRHPPRLTGVTARRVSDGGREYVDFDCEVVWDGLPDWTLRLLPTALLKIVPGAPGGLSLHVSPSVYLRLDMAQFCGRMRFRVGRLLPGMPLVHALQMAFIDKPFISLGLSVGADRSSMSELTVLSALLSSQVTRAIARFTWPSVIPLVDLSAMVGRKAALAATYSFRQVPHRWLSARSEMGIGSEEELAAVVAEAEAAAAAADVCGGGERGGGGGGGGGGGNCGTTGFAGVRQEKEQEEGGGGGGGGFLSGLLGLGGDGGARRGGGIGGAGGGVEEGSLEGDAGLEWWQRDEQPVAVLEVHLVSAQLQGLVSSSGRGLTFGEEVHPFLVLTTQSPDGQLEASPHGHKLLPQVHVSGVSLDASSPRYEETALMVLYGSSSSSSSRGGMNSSGDIDSNGLGSVHGGRAAAAHSEPAAAAAAAAAAVDAHGTMAAVGCGQLLRVAVADHRYLWDPEYGYLYDTLIASGKLEVDMPPPPPAAAAAAAAAAEVPTGDVAGTAQTPHHQRLKRMPSGTFADQTPQQQQQKGSASNTSAAGSASGTSAASNGVAAGPCNSGSAVSRGSSTGSPGKQRTGHGSTPSVASGGSSSGGGEGARLGESWVEVDPEELGRVAGPSGAGSGIAATLLDASGGPATSGSKHGLEQLFAGVVASADGIAGDLDLSSSQQLTPTDGSGGGGGGGVPWTSTFVNLRPEPGVASEVVPEILLLPFRDYRAAITEERHQGHKERRLASHTPSAGTVPSTSSSARAAPHTGAGLSSTAEAPPCAPTVPSASSSASTDVSAAAESPQVSPFASYSSLLLDRGGNVGGGVGGGGSVVGGGGGMGEDVVVGGGGGGGGGDGAVGGGAVAGGAAGGVRGVQAGGRHSSSSSSSSPGGGAAAGVVGGAGAAGAGAANARGGGGGREAGMARSLSRRMSWAEGNGDLRERSLSTSLGLLMAPSPSTHTATPSHRGGGSGADRGGGGRGGVDRGGADRCGGGAGGGSLPASSGSGAGDRQFDESSGVEGLGAAIKGRFAWFWDTILGDEDDDAESLGMMDSMGFNAGAVLGGAPTASTELPRMPAAGSSPGGLLPQAASGLPQAASGLPQAASNDAYAMSRKQSLRGLFLPRAVQLPDLPAPQLPPGAVRHTRLGAALGLTNTAAGGGSFGGAGDFGGGGGGGGALPGPWVDGKAGGGGGKGMRREHWMGSVKLRYRVHPLLAQDSATVQHAAIGDDGGPSADAHKPRVTTTIPPPLPSPVSPAPGGVGVLHVLVEWAWLRGAAQDSDAVPRMVVRCGAAHALKVEGSSTRRLTQVTGGGGGGTHHIFDRSMTFALRLPLPAATPPAGVSATPPAGASAATPASSEQRSGGSNGTGSDGSSDGSNASGGGGRQGGGAQGGGGSSGSSNGIGGGGKEEEDEQAGLPDLELQLVRLPDKWHVAFLKLWDDPWAHAHNVAHAWLPLSRLATQGSSWDGDLPLLPSGPPTRRHKKQSRESARPDDACGMLRVRCRWLGAS